MRFIFIPIVIFLMVELSIALPVIKHQDENSKQHENEINVEKHEIDETKNKIHINDPHERSKWDEEKRIVITTLKQLYDTKRELENEENFKHHDSADSAKFRAAEIARLNRLIAKVSEESDQLDRKRHELFKQYEMQKNFEEYQKELAMSEEERKEFHKKVEDLKKKHKNHEPLSHPGSRRQLEEVWEEEDEMTQQFDPTTFFLLHDVDDNGVWDENELKSIFHKDLDKMYQKGLPEDDLYERYEEMERMKEHVLKEVDTNKDRLIDLSEFLEQTKKSEFAKDEGWKALDEQEIYGTDEYDNYIKLHQQAQAAQEREHAAANNVLQPPQAQGNPNMQLHQEYMPNPVQYQNQIPQYQQYQNHPQNPVQYQHQSQQQMPMYQQQQVPEQRQQYQQQQEQPAAAEIRHASPQNIPNQLNVQQQQQYHQQQQQQHHQQQQQQHHQQQQQQQQHQQEQQQHHQLQQQQQHQQQQQQHQQQQHQIINNGQLNAQTSPPPPPPIHQNTQNQAPVQQQQHASNSIEKNNSHAVPAPAMNANHI